MFLSDVHLGTKGCQADALLDFLARMTPRRSTWSATSSMAGGCAQAGTGRRITMTSCRCFCARRAGHPHRRCARQSRRVPARVSRDLFRRGRVRRSRRARRRRGKTYLVIHGDQFDVVVRHAKWLAHVGDWAYRAALRLNIAVNWVRRRLGLHLLVALGLGQAQGQERRQRHRPLRGSADARGPRQRRRRRHLRPHPLRRHARPAGIHYVNTGDWVESCTAVAETMTASLELVRWTARRARSRALTPDRASASGGSRPEPVRTLCGSRVERICTICVPIRG